MAEGSGTEFKVLVRRIAVLAKAIDRLEVEECENEDGSKFRFDDLSNEDAWFVGWQFALIGADEDFDFDEVEFRQLAYNGCQNRALVFCDKLDAYKSPTLDACEREDLGYGDDPEGKIRKSVLASVMHCSASGIMGLYNVFQDGFADGHAYSPEVTADFAYGSGGEIYISGDVIEKIDPRTFMAMYADYLCPAEISSKYLVRDEDGEAGIDISQYIADGCLDDLEWVDGGQEIIAWAAMPKKKGGKKKKKKAPVADILLRPDPVVFIDLEVNPEEAKAESAASEVLQFGSWKGKSIEWLVLAKEPDRMLLLSKYALDRKPYNKKWEDTTWE